MKLNRLIVVLYCGIALTACAGKMLNPTVGVSVSGVNYTGKDASYVLQDPHHPENSAGGEDMLPYGAGGIMCCYALPATWRPGIQVKVMVYDERRNLAKEVLAEVPPYVKGKPGQLWAVLYPDGSVEAVSSDANPGHPDWPGKVKGWPVASKEYQTMLWEREIKEIKNKVERWSEPISKDPEKLARFWSLHGRLTAETKSALKKFSGPDDPAFYEYLVNDQKKMLEDYKHSLEQMLKSRP